MPFQIFGELLGGGVGDFQEGLGESSPSEGAVQRDGVGYPDKAQGLAHLPLVQAGGLGKLGIQPLGEGIGCVLGEFFLDIVGYLPQLGNGILWDAGRRPCRRTG